jgi:hypothetical protein
MTGEAAYLAIEAAFGAPATLAAIEPLTPEQRQALRQFWIGRARGELTTALSFEFMLDDLRALGAPAVLTELAERSIADEHRHVDWCLRFARLWGAGAPAEASLSGTRPLELDGASEHDSRILRTVFGCCFSETVATHVLLASQERLELESVRRLNHQHIAEEVGHARLGWGLLGWSGLTQRDRDMVGHFVATMTDLTRSAWYGPGYGADPALEQLGYLPQPLVRGACEAALTDVILPGLEQNGVRVV